MKGERYQKSQNNVKVHISKALDNNSQEFIVAKKNSFTIHKFEKSEKSNRENFSGFYNSVLSLRIAENLNLDLEFFLYHSTLIILV